MKRVVYTAELPPSVEAALAARFDARRIALSAIGRDAFLAAIGDADGLVVVPGDPIDAGLIAALSETVRIIASYSTGLDHVDVAAARARGIKVTNTPDVLTDATADIAMLLILGVLRGASRAERLLRDRDWTGWAPAQTFGVDLGGRVLGIVGPGRIGLATARRAQAFGMQIAYWGRRRMPNFDAIRAEAILDFGAFLASVDIVSLHVPSTSETKRLIDAAAVAQMRDGAFLINTARGDLIDDAAVIAALEAGKLGGVGLDVFAGEPAIDARWYDAPRAFLLPHIGSATEGTRAAMGAKVLESLELAFSEVGVAA